MLVKYILKQVVHNIVHKQPITKANFEQGFRMYRETKSQIENQKKSIWKVLRELETISNYWKGFPDSYFRMGMFMEEWDDIRRMKSFVPQDAYSRYAKDNDVRYHLLIDDKILFHDLLSLYGLPVPHRYFVFRSNIFRSGNTILTDFDVDKIIKEIPENRIFVKRYIGGAASGVSLFVKNLNGYFVDSENDVVSAYMIRNKYKDQDYIFEQQITQEHTLAQFNPDTVNTIRVLTYNNKIIAAAIRFGGKGEYVDNVSAHGVACSLDIETGVLSDFGLRMYSIDKYYEHPDTHVKFKDVYVEQWPQVKELVGRTLMFLPYYKSVGFDIATTNNGPLILEINTGAGINLTQMGKKYGLEKYFKA